MVRRAILILIVLVFLLSGNVFAANPVTSNSVVSASITSGDLYSPTLISPPDNHASRSAMFTFVWRRPSPLPSTTLDHYDLFIDNAIFASNVPDSLTSQDLYFYTATGSSGLFYIGLKQALAEGYHTWRVAVYDNIGRNTATGNWNFYIDSIVPFISLLQIDSSVYDWNSAVSGSIPAESERYLEVDNDSPSLSGNMEQNANLLISLICPSGAPAECVNQSWVINSTDGSWEKQFSGLIQDINYTVNLSATDATGNSTLFPVFYLKYIVGGSYPTDDVFDDGVTEDLEDELDDGDSSGNYTDDYSSEDVDYEMQELQVSPSISQEALPGVSLTLTPPSGLSALVTPTPFVSRVAPTPTLPPQKVERESTGGYGYLILILLLCLGLPTHLLFVGMGLGVRLVNLFRFLFGLFFPFLRFVSAKIRPFCFVELSGVENGRKYLYRTMSNIVGDVYFPKKIPNKVVVAIESTWYFWNEKAINTNLLFSSCLLPFLKKRYSSWEQFLVFLYSLRSIPLALAVITSSVGLYFYNSWYLLAYLYLSLQLVFSEYIYPKMKNKEE